MRPKKSISHEEMAKPTLNELVRSPVPAAGARVVVLVLVPALHAGSAVGGVDVAGNAFGRQGEHDAAGAFVVGDLECRREELAGDGRRDHAAAGRVPLVGALDQVAVELEAHGCPRW